MYSRTDSPAHIIHEVIDNASDEALAGFATAIRVTLHNDGSVSVEDDGRGIPVGLHPTEKVSTLELVFSDNQGRRHLSVAEDSFADESLQLNTASTNYPISDLGRTLCRRVARQLFELHSGNVDVNVDSIKQRP